jgi:hypothetical protein
MARLSGLGDLYSRLDTSPKGYIDEGVEEARAAPGTPDSRHAYPGDTSGEEYPAGFGAGYQAGTYYPEQENRGEYDYPGVCFYDPGVPLDQTPSGHGGAYPRPLATMYSTVTPDDFAIVGEQMTELHCRDLGGPRVLNQRAPGGREAPVNVTADRYESPAENNLQRTHGQMRHPGTGSAGGSGGHLGAADVDQGYGELNTDPEFQHGHSIRVVQHDRMPWDFSILRGSEGTWLGKHPIMETRFDGPDSPYDMAGLPNRLQVAEKRGYPTEYVPPAEPTVLPAPAGDSGTDVWTGTWTAG